MPHIVYAFVFCGSNATNDGLLSGVDKLESLKRNMTWYNETIRQTLQ